MGRLSGLGPERVVRALGKLGWREVRSSGSHRILASAHGKTVCVPFHKGRAIPEGTLRGILRDAGLTADELLRHY